MNYDDINFWVAAQKSYSCLEVKRVQPLLALTVGIAVCQILNEFGNLVGMGLLVGNQIV
jgi:hypothetical protein